MKFFDKRHSLVIAHVRYQYDSSTFDTRSSGEYKQHYCLKKWASKRLCGSAPSFSFQLLSPQKVNLLHPRFF